MLLRGSIPLSTIFEPVRHLRQGESGFLGQIPLLIRCGVSIGLVGIFEYLPGFLFEAVDCLFAVPDGFGEWILAS